MSFRSASLMFRRAMAGVALASVFALSACGDDSPGPSGDVYTLRSIDGVNLPYSETDEDGTATLASGSLTLKTNNTYSFRSRVTFDPSAPGPTQTLTIGEDGTYTRSGNNLTMTSTHDIIGSDRSPSEGDVTTATISGNTLTATSTDEFGTTVLVFTK